MIKIVSLFLIAMLVLALFGRLRLPGLDKLDKNVAQYIKSGSRPCNVASMGEYTVGASYAMRAIKNIEEGYPISMVIPAEGSGNELEANALVALRRPHFLTRLEEFIDVDL